MQINFGTIRRFLDLAQRAYSEYQKIQGKQPQSSGSASSQRHRTSDSLRRTSVPGTYPGDYVGPVNFSYSPDADGAPDPGEVVWAWVPYEEDYSQGKDRPIILIGKDGQYLLALMLTSKDHNNRNTHDPAYLDIGVGLWDKQGRPSEVKLDRVIRVLPEEVRREGAIMDGGTFNRIQRAFEQTNN